MSRLVGKRTSDDRGAPLSESVAPQGSPIADYLERVAKYVPVEILGALLAIRGVLPAHGTPGALPAPAEVVLFVILVVLTPIYLVRIGGSAPQKVRQVTIATVSFVIWSYTIGGPFFWDSVADLSHHQIVYPGLAGALVVIWSLAAGLFQPIATDQRG
jgi:hypothetical protein